MYTSDIKYGENTSESKRNAAVDNDSDRLKTEYAVWNDKYMPQKEDTEAAKTDTDCLKTALIYLCISIFCAFFGAVYEHFSHEVYSYYMLYAFAFPLIGGAFVFLSLAIHYVKAPCRIAQNLYHSGIATLTVGSIFTGTFEIYGTTNQLVRVYWIVGAVLTVVGIIVAILSKHNQ